MCLTFPQVHGVSLTFVREVEGGVIQDESDHNITHNLHQDIYTGSHQFIYCDTNIIFMFD